MTPLLKLQGTQEKVFSLVKREEYVCRIAGMVLEKIGDLQVTFFYQYCSRETSSCLGTVLHGKARARIVSD